MLGANCLAALFIGDHSPQDAHRIALDHLAGAGFGVTEISQPGLLPVQDAPRVRHHAEGLGLAIRAVHALPMRREPTLRRQRAAALLAAELGAEILVVHVSSIRFASPDPAVRAVARERDLERLDSLAGFCADFGIALGLENSQRPGHAQYLLSLLAALDHPTAGLVFDSGHAVLRGGDPLAIARMMLPRLLHTHLHDNHGTRDEHLAPGDGIIHWAGLLALLRDGGYAGARLLELRPRRASPAAEGTSAAAGPGSGGSGGGVLAARERWLEELARARQVLAAE